MEYYKNKKVQTKEQAESLLAGMSDFINPDHPRTVPPMLDKELTDIWNSGDVLPWEWSEKSEAEIESEAQAEASKAEKEAAYAADVELWKNEVIRPVRGALMIQWVDAYASKPLLWAELQETNQPLVQEVLDVRQMLKDWPDDFTEYTPDFQRPPTPSYIKA